MSTIAIIKTIDGKIHMGADSLCSYKESGFVEKRLNKKIFKKTIVDRDDFKTHFLIGSVGTYRLMQLLEFEFNVPFIPKKMDLKTYMVTKFVPKLRALIESHKFDFKEVEIVVAVNGEYFIIQTDYQVGFVDAPFYALGSGGGFAFGSLHSTDTDGELDEDVRIMMALKAAEHYDSKTGGEFYLEKLG